MFLDVGKTVTDSAAAVNMTKSAAAVNVTEWAAVVNVTESAAAVNVTEAATLSSVTASLLLDQIDHLISDQSTQNFTTSTAGPVIVAQSGNETAHALLAALLELRSHVVSHHNLIGSQLMANITRHLSAEPAEDDEGTRNQLRDLIRKGFDNDCYHSIKVNFYEIGFM